MLQKIEDTVLLELGIEDAHEYNVLVEKSRNRCAIPLGAASWSCPACGEVLAARYKYCPCCGQKLMYRGHTEEPLAAADELPDTIPFDSDLYDKVFTKHEPKEGDAEDADIHD